MLSAGIGSPAGTAVTAGTTAAEAQWRGLGEPGVHAADPAQIAGQADLADLAAAMVGIGRSV